MKVFLKSVLTIFFTIWFLIFIKVIFIDKSTFAFEIPPHEFSNMTYKDKIDQNKKDYNKFPSFKKIKDIEKEYEKNN